MKTSIFKQLKEALLTKNPVFVQFLGLCPALAVTASVAGAIGMGAATCAVLVFSSLFISLLKRFVPEKIRTLTYLIIISCFVSAVELLFKAFLPDIAVSLGIFIPLIAVNGIILSRAEGFASENALLPSVIDGFATGIGFSLVLICTAVVREALGTGKIFASPDGSGGISLFGDAFPGTSVFLLPAGAFITLGFVLALVQKISTLCQRDKTKASEADGHKQVQELLLNEEDVANE